MAMPTFSMPLGQKPTLRLIGRGLHGRYRVERYRLKNLWCLHLYTYRARLVLDGTELAIEPGHLGVIPPDANLAYHLDGPCEHLFAHFELTSPAHVCPVPAMQATGTDFAQLYRMFEEAVGMYPTQPLRAEVRLWDLLWHAAEKQESRRRHSAHPAVAETIRQIELRLQEPLLVEELARQAGLSHNHLTRLFRAETGKTVKGYLLERRMSKARHLLQKSSSPIKGIAFDVGYGDLHAFNKIVRRRFGCSPRQLRQKGGR